MRFRAGFGKAGTRFRLARGAMFILLAALARLYACAQTLGMADNEDFVDILNRGLERMGSDVRAEVIMTDVYHPKPVKNMTISPSSMTPDLAARIAGAAGLYSWEMAEYVQWPKYEGEGTPTP